MLSRKRKRDELIDPVSTMTEPHEDLVMPSKREYRLTAICSSNPQTPVTSKKSCSLTSVNQEKPMPNLCDIPVDDSGKCRVGKKPRKQNKMQTLIFAEDSENLGVEERRRSARLLNRDAEKEFRESDDNDELQVGSSPNSPRRRKKDKSRSSRPHKSMPNKVKKKKKKKKIAGKGVDSEPDSEKEITEAGSDGNFLKSRGCVLGGFGTDNKNNAHTTKGMPLLGGLSCQGWTKEQEIALHNAYYTIKPVPNFWKEIAKLVPGKSSKECFNRFYSAHPTPPVSQTRSRTNGKNSGSPIRSFANDIHSLLKSSRSSSRRPNSSKQKILHAHKTVRQILRKCKSADKEYETDLFSAVETVDSSVPSLLLPTINTPITPNCVPRTAGISSSDQSLSLHCTKTLSRFSADAHLQLQKQLVSPEVLKRIKNPALHDKYIDLLHSREVARKKTWAQNAKVQSNPFQTKVLDLPKTEVVCAAKAAVIAEAQQVIRQSQTNRKGNCLGIYYHSSENGEEEIDEDDEDAGDEEEEIEDADLS